MVNINTSFSSKSQHHDFSSTGMVNSLVNLGAYALLRCDSPDGPVVMSCASVPGSCPPRAAILGARSHAAGRGRAAGNLAAENFRNNANICQSWTNFGELRLRAS